MIDKAKDVMSNLEEFEYHWIWVWCSIRTKKEILARVTYDSFQIHIDECGRTRLDVLDVLFDKATMRNLMLTYGQWHTVQCFIIYVYTCWIECAKVDLKWYLNFCFSVKFNAKRNLLVTGSFDELFKIWDVRMGECIVYPNDWHHTRILSALE